MGPSRALAIFSIDTSAMHSGFPALMLTARASARRAWKWRWLAVSVAWAVALGSGLLISLLPHHEEPAPGIPGSDAAGASLQPGSRPGEEEARRHERHLDEAENRLRAFKLDALGDADLTPEDMLAHASTLAQEVGQLKVELAAARRTRDLHRTELADVRQAALRSGTGGGDAANVPGDLDLQVQAQRRHLEDLLRRYTEAHPDVIQARQGLARLESEKARAQAAPPPGSADEGRGAGIASTQGLRVRLSEAEAEVALLRSALDGQQKHLDALRARIDQMPQWQAKLDQLTRARDAARQQRDQTLARSGPVGGEAHAGSFQRAGLISMAQPEAPRSSPGEGRLLWAAGAMLLSLAAACGAVLLAERLRPTIGDSDSLARASGRPVLGRVSVHPSEAGHRAARQDARQLVWAAASLCVLQLAWLGWMAWESFRKGAA